MITTRMWENERKQNKKNNFIFILYFSVRKSLNPLMKAPVVPSFRHLDWTGLLCFTLFVNTYFNTRNITVQIWHCERTSMINCISNNIIRIKISCRIISYQLNLNKLQLRLFVQISTQIQATHLQNSQWVPQD